MVMFFSNDFGLIDIKKTAIITAIAIDKKEDEFEVTAQIAVPEATDTNTENQKAQVSGKGSTVGAAIKDIGDVTGWFPKLDFCNLVIIGEEATKENVIKVLDYFAKTLRIQDSAVVVSCKNTAKEVLELSTPLDNLSSFALQKVLLKTSGFDRDVVDSNIKSFVVGYYSDAKSSITPLIEVEKQKNGKQSTSGGSGGSSGSGGSTQQSSGQAKDNNKGDSLFSARTTALFYNGVKVGELTPEQTLAYNMLFDDFRNSTIELKDVAMANGDKRSFLLTVKKCKPKINVKADNNGITLDIFLDIYCKISDQTATSSDSTFSKNPELPEEVVKNAESTIYSWIESLIETEKQTACDFLKIKQEIYRKNHKYYNAYKDTFLTQLTPNITVKVSGQK